ncbi:MAG: hypothetical protein R3B06_20295 [Kofleriaceae bacterium]
MCLRVFVAAAAPLPARPKPPAGIRPTFWVEPLADGDLRQVRAALDQPHVVEVGAHTGCACGFASAELAFDAGVATRAALAALEPALADDARAELARADASRAALRDLVEQGLGAGPVRIYGVWWGDEASLPVAHRAIALDQLVDQLEPIPEKTVLSVIAPAARP